MIIMSLPQQFIPTDVYMSGKSAFCAGWSQQTNPWEAGSEEHDQWSDGWDDANCSQSVLPFLEGGDAHAFAESLSANPWSVVSEEHTLWTDGWLAAAAAPKHL
jgi:hypothetical protein